MHTFITNKLKKE